MQRGIFRKTQSIFNYSLVPKIKYNSKFSALELFRRRKVTVPSGSGKSVTFVIRPRVLGYINIKVMANGKIAGDAIEKRLLVKVSIF